MRTSYLIGLVSIETILMPKFETEKSALSAWIESEIHYDVPSISIEADIKINKDFSILQMSTRTHRGKYYIH